MSGITLKEWPRNKRIRGTLQVVPKDKKTMKYCLKMGFSTKLAIRRKKKSSVRKKKAVFRSSFLLSNGYRKADLNDKVSRFYWQKANFPIDGAFAMKPIICWEDWEALSSNFHRHQSMQAWVELEFCELIPGHAQLSKLNGIPVPLRNQRLPNRAENFNPSHEGIIWSKGADLLVWWMYHTHT